jgi:hypothetical protein
MGFVRGERGEGVARCMMCVKCNNCYQTLHEDEGFSALLSQPGAATHVTTFTGGGRYQGMDRGSPSRMFGYGPADDASLGFRV